MSVNRQKLITICAAAFALIVICAGCQRHDLQSGGARLVLQLCRLRPAGAEPLSCRRCRGRRDWPLRHIIRCADHFRLCCCPGQQIHQRNANPAYQSAAKYSASGYGIPLRPSAAKAKRACLALAPLSIKPVGGLTLARRGLRTCTERIPATARLLNSVAP